MPNTTSIQTNTERARRTKESYVASLCSTPSTTTITQPPIQNVATGTKERRKRMSGLRRAIAKRLVEVKNNTAMLTTFNEVDMSAVIDIRNREKEPFFKNIT